MRMASRFALAPLLVAATGAVAYAHPGHAHEIVTAESPWHYLLQPEHALITGIALAVISGFFVTGYLRMMVKRNQRLLQPLRVRR